MLRHWQGVVEWERPRCPAQDGNTARCVILAHDGQRTMRTCFENAVRLDAGSVEEASFAGCKWAFVSCYALYTEGLLDKVLELAEKAGARVALDLAGAAVTQPARLGLPCTQPSPVCLPAPQASAWLPTCLTTPH